MAKKGKEIVYESFEDRKFAILMGFLCLVYFGIFYAPLEGTEWVARILPAWPLKVFAGLAFVTFVLQVIVWKLFRHFYKRWYLSPATLLLFLCEFGLILFTVMFFSWPIYWLLIALTPAR